jgi:hypothetical protein
MESAAVANGPLGERGVMGYNKLTRTPYGQVRKVVLERLQQSFDTRELLATVDEIDRFCAQWTEELRSDLLRLHGMAHCVINDAPLTQPASKETLAEMAASLSLAFEDAAKSLRSLPGILDQLADLGPE